MIVRKINLTDILLSVGFIAFFIPAQYALPNSIYTIWKTMYIFVALFSLGMVFVSRKLRISKGFAFCVLYYFWMYFCTWFFSKSGDLNPSGFLRCLGFIALLEFSLQRYKREKAIRAFLTAGIIMSLAYFVSFIIYKDVVGGMRADTIYYVGDRIIRYATQNYYLLTYDNNSIYYFLPVIVLLLYYGMLYNKGVLKYLVLYIMFILYMYIYKKAATATIAMVVLIAILSFVIIRKEKQKEGVVGKILVNTKSATKWGIIIDVMAVVSLGSGFAGWIGSFFGKKATFTGRDVIWRKSLKYIYENLLFGNGMEDQTTVVNKINQTHCHNLVLENLYVGGIIGILLFFLVIHFYRPKGKDLFALSLFSAAIITYFLVGSMDWLVTNPLPMAIFVFNYYINNSNNKLILSSEI